MNRVIPGYLRTGFPPLVGPRDNWCLLNLHHRAMQAYSYQSRSNLIRMIINVPFDRYHLSLEHFKQSHSDPLIYGEIDKYCQIDSQRIEASPCTHYVIPLSLRMITLWACRTVQITWLKREGNTVAIQLSSAHTWSAKCYNIPSFNCDAFVFQNVIQRNASVFSWYLVLRLNSVQYRKNLTTTSTQKWTLSYVIKYEMKCLYMLTLYFNRTPNVSIVE